MFRNQRTNNLTHLTPTIPVAETSIFFNIMEPRVSDIVVLGDERVRSAVNSDYVRPL